MSQPSMNSMGGAVDLSAFATAKKQEEAREQMTGEDGRQVVPGAIVRDLTKDNLQAFLETSVYVPLVVVFTSARAEGSLTLRSTLETEVRGRGGAIGLGVVDADTAPELAQAFQVQAVPTTLAVISGNPIPLFQGTATPEDTRAALDNVANAASQMGLAGTLDGDEQGTPPEPELPPHVAEAQAAFDSGDLETAHAEYTEALRENPGDKASQAGLKQVEFLQRVQGAGAQETLEKAAAAELTDAGLHLEAADVEVAAGRPDSAFARLLAVIGATSGDERERARARLVELFDIVGTKDPIVVDARRKLANALM